MNVLYIISIELKFICNINWGTVFYYLIKNYTIGQHHS